MKTATLHDGPDGRRRILDKCARFIIIPQFIGGFHEVLISCYFSLCAGGLPDGNTNGMATAKVVRTEFRASLSRQERHSALFDMLPAQHAQI